MLSASTSGGRPTPILHEACDWRWASPEELEELPLPAAHRKLAEQCGLCPGSQYHLDFNN